MTTRTSKLTSKTSNGWAESPWPTLIAVCAILIASVQVVISQQQNAHTIGCLTTYANRLNAALTPRSNAGADLQDKDFAYKQALLKFQIDLTNKAVPNKAKLEELKQVTRALQSYTDTYQQVQRTRKEHPYPTPPTVNC
jgi:hypothetical protein